MRISDSLRRAVWFVLNRSLFRLTPIYLFAFRAYLLRCFGATLENGVYIYPSVLIRDPSNLKMSAGAVLGRNVYLLNTSLVELGERAIVSERAIICTASRDFYDPTLPVVSAPVTIGKNTWLGLGVFIGPGVSIGQNSVVYAQISVTRNIGSNMMVTNKQSILIKERKFR